MRLLQAFRKRYGLMLTVLPNDALRRQLGIQRPKLNDPSDLLSHPRPTLNMRHLARMRVDDLCPETTVIQDEVADQPVHLPGQGAFDTTRINQLFVGKQKIRRGLELYRFRDVFLVHKINRFCLFDGDRIDLRSSGLPGAEALRKRTAGDFTELPAAAFCGDHWLPSNPAHFVSDQLTRALIFRDWLDCPPDQILLHHTDAPLCTHLMHQIDPQFQLMAPDRLYFIRDLRMLSSSRYDRAQGHPFWFLDSGLLNTVRRAAQTGASPRGGDAPRIIYFSRTDASRRRLVNEGALIDALRAYGVRAVVMSDLSGADQMQLVAGAEVVIAPHGGALLNLVAARPGTRAVELFTPEMGTLAFAGMALASGLDYRFHIGQPAGGMPWHNLPWTADIPEVLRLAGLTG